MVRNPKLPFDQQKNDFRKIKFHFCKFCIQNWILFWESFQWINHNVAQNQTQIHPRQRNSKGHLSLKLRKRKPHPSYKNTSTLKIKESPVPKNDFLIKNDCVINPPKTKPFVSLIRKRSSPLFEIFRFNLFNSRSIWNSIEMFGIIQVPDIVLKYRRKIIINLFIKLKMPDYHLK